MMRRNYYVYIMTNKYHTVLYTGVTNDLAKRAWQHRGKATPGFTSRYNVVKRVYYETFEDVRDAIAREKQIKGGSEEEGRPGQQHEQRVARPMRGVGLGAFFVGSWRLLRFARNDIAHGHDSQ